MIKFYEKWVVIFKERQQDSLGKFDLQDLDSAAEGRSRIDGRRINNYVKIINHRPPTHGTLRYSTRPCKAATPFKFQEYPYSRISPSPRG